MKTLTLKLAVLGTLAAVSAPAMADWTALPASGGSSAYIACNPTGNFGSGSGASAPVKPTSTADACAVIPSTETTVPDSNFSGANAIPVASATRTVTMNNVYTNFTNVVIGDVREIVWRRQVTSSPATYQCIYAMKVNLTNVDYNLTAAGTQNFEVNDIARGGWTGLTTDVAYSTKPTVAEPTYRIGRAYTSVQHRATGYSSLPPTGLGSNPSINGLNSFPGTASASQQQADYDTNWIDFTTDANFLDDDGSTAASSGTYYVRTACSATNPTATANAIRLRQTFQELAGDGVTANPFIEVPVTGFLPTLGSGVVTPAPNAPTSPY